MSQSSANTTTSSPAQSSNLVFQTLVVASDAEVRKRVCDWLAELKVGQIGVDSVGQAKEVFKNQPLIVLLVEHSGSEVLEFPAWARAQSGQQQPYILALGVVPAQHRQSFNDSSSPNLSKNHLQGYVEAAQRWQAWTTALQKAGKHEITSESDAILLTPAYEVPAANAETQRELESVISTNQLIAGADLFSPDERVQLNFLQEMMTKTGAEFRLVTADGKLLDGSSHFVPSNLHWWDDWELQPKNELAAQRFLEILRKPTCEPCWQESLTARYKTGRGWEEITWQLNPLLLATGTPKAVLLLATHRQPHGPQTSVEPPTLQSIPESVLFQLVMEKSPYGIILLDEAGGVIYSNPQIQSLLGHSLPPPIAIGMAAWLEQSLAVETEAIANITDQWWRQVFHKRTNTVLTMLTDSGIVKEIEFRPSSLPQGNLMLTVFDATDTRRAEESIRASEARYRSIFNQSAIATVLVNPAGNIADANAAFERIAGCSRMDIRRVGFEPFFHVEALQRIQENAQTVSRLGESQPVHCRFRPRGGTEIPVAVCVSIIKNVNGQPVFTAYQLQALETAFPHSLTPTNHLPPNPLFMPANNVTLEQLATVADVVLEIDSLGRLISSQGQTHLASFSLSHPITTGHLHDFPFLQSLNLSALRLEIGMDNVKPRSAKTIVEFKTSKGLPAQLEAKLCRFPGAESQYLLLTDCTASPAAKPAPEADFTYSAIRMLKQAALMISTKGRITDCNASAEEMFGYAKAELVGQGLHKLFLPEQPQEFTKIVSEQLNKHRCWIGKSSYYHKDGTRGRLSIELVPFDDFGNRGLLALMRDHKEPEPNTSPSTAPQQDGLKALHRAKNDFQILTSLLNLQTESLPSESDARQALAEGRDRVFLVSAVYRLLDAATSTVQFRPLAQEIAQRIIASVEMDTKITFGVEDANPAPLAHRQAMPLALLLAELVRNAAADCQATDAEQKRGHIHISLRRMETEDASGVEAVLQVKNSGPAPSESVQNQRARSVGGKVLDAVSQQLRAKVTTTTEGENCCEVVFPFDPELPT